MDFPPPPSPEPAARPAQRNVGLQVLAEDLVLIAPGDARLNAIPAALPPGVRLEAPPLPFTLEAWTLCGGIGRLTARPARQDVLGLTFVSPRHGRIEVGGRVVKNVAGYNATHLIVGLDPSLETPVHVDALTLRLRPGPPARTRGRDLPHAPGPDDWAELAALGAAFAYAWPEGEAWRLQGVWLDDPRPAGLPPLAVRPGEGWGEVDDPPGGDSLPDGFLDALGPVPRPPRALTDLERRVVDAL
ncbi:MAG TPA: hypothetical protein VHN99_04925 [Deinococcales bacterium]|nr:hypothetical protein [Deinococcales bacterium]